MNPFTWLRNATRNAVLSGIGDAMAEVSSGDAAPVTLEDLRTRLALPAVTPAEEPEKPKTKSRTKVDA